MIRILIAAWLLCAGASAQAAERHAFLRGVETFSASFEQVQIDEDGREIGRRSGQFALARPGRFRWHYTAPYEQLMVCDGEQIWNYEPDLAQVVVRDAGPVLRDTPAALLAQSEPLDQRFAVEDRGRQDGLQWLVLTPRAEDADIRSIELWLAEAGTPARMRLHDPLGGISDIRFGDARRNPRLAPELFRFEVPAGVETVRLDGAGQ